MTPTSCSSDTPEVCGHDARHPLVRARDVLAGIDYAEVYPDGINLCVHFFGALPRHLGIGNVVIEGGVRVRDIAVSSARFHEHENGDLCLLLTLDKTGDFSPYCVCLVQPIASEVNCSFDDPPPRRRRVPEGIDPRYACASFSFCSDRPSTLDCKPEPCPPPPKPPSPAIDYLARDYESFRRLIFDRLAQTMPHWQERYAPDIGITLVELLAYVADQLSYQLDAVATEAFLHTARRRISVRRHARLVDYWMHEGCNARAWITIASDSDCSLPLSDLAFAAFSGDAVRHAGSVRDWHELRQIPGAVIFEPMQLGHGDTLDIVAAHSEIHFYTWQRAECCLPAGSTRATLLDRPMQADQKPADAGACDVEEPPRRLQLKPGDFLIFEEIRGCLTGAVADADPGKRHVVRLTRVELAIDPLTCTPVWEVEWCDDDALPFDLLLSVRTVPPECRVEPAAVARGNVLLVDHGMRSDEERKWCVGLEGDELCCLCDGENTELRQSPARLAIELDSHPITHAEPLPEADCSATALMQRDPRAAVPSVWLTAQPDRLAEGQPEEVWSAVRDLLASGPADRHFMVEIDDESRAHLRFGDGVNGRVPAPGWCFKAGYRVGNGPGGNVGRDTIVCMAGKTHLLSGARLMPRNPLPATGGLGPEPIEAVKCHAPYAYGRVLERAVAADDYAQLAQGDRRVQGAHAELAWTGSWYEASVALDTLAQYAVGEVASDVSVRLERARRIGHDLRLVPARHVPLEISLSICVEPHFLRSEVERAVRTVLSSRMLADGSRGMFHPDQLGFGEDIAGSRIIAAVQALEGVAHVELVTFARMYASAAEARRSREDMVIAIAPDEVARLDSDPNFPEHGCLKLELKGGR